MQKMHGFPSSTVTIALAASGKKGSKLALRWALDNLCDERRIKFKIMHVRPKVTIFHSPTGSIPISAVRPDVAAAYIDGIDSKAFEMLSPYKRMCAQRKVESETLVIEGDDLVDAISAEVTRYRISKLILGGSERKDISRKLIGNGPPVAGLGWDPHFCTVYFVSRGKLSLVHTASLRIYKGAEVATVWTTDSINSFSSYESTEIDNHSEVSTSMSDIQTDSSFSNGQLPELNTLKTSTEEEKAREPTKSIKEKHKVAESNATFTSECLEEKLLEKKVTVSIAAPKVTEKHKLESAVANLDQIFENFDWEEVISGTSSFSDSFRIGDGSYGTVYKCTLRHITVAVKVLKSIDVQKDKQFQRELELLSRIRHPHLLPLLGTCPDHGCLVYEYMENGSLDDRLRMENGTDPISWFDRIQIAWEVASALLFLHSSKPQPVVHCDLKPANILLDHNLVSKIGDVGLSTLISMVRSTKLITYNKSSFVGTYGYVDPEYQRTGVVSPMSDLYAFGIIILQLLTGQPPIGLADYVEKAMEDCNFQEVLDVNAGKWPIKEARDLTYLGLRCAEVRNKDRPNLKDDVLPLLVRFKEAADHEKHSILNHEPARRSISPILKDSVEDGGSKPDSVVYDI